MVLPLVNCGRTSKTDLSVRVNSRRFDHRLPFGDFGGKVLVECRRCGTFLRYWLGAEVGQTLDHLLVLERALEGGGQLVDNRLRGALRGVKAVPCDNFKALDTRLVHG